MSNDPAVHPPEGSPPRVVVVIVHYKTPDLLKNCLASLLPELDPARDRVVLVDSASGEPYVAPLRPLAQSPLVTLLESPQNLGFAGANNRAIAHALAAGRPEYFLLLNPDTILRPNALALLIDFLRTRPDAAFVGPRLEDLDATPQLSAFRDHSPMSEFLRGANIGPLTRLLRPWQVYGELQNHPHRAQWLSGACVLLRTEVLDAIGLLDPGFFLYFEESDFFRRARRAGFPAWHLPDAHVVHLVGQSSGIANDLAATRLPAYWFESRHRYFRKHYGYLGMIAADAAYLAGRALDRLRRFFTGVSHSSVARCETRDFLRHCLRQARHFRATGAPP